MVDSPTSNLPELTVTELSQALKRTIETAYDQVRVRGELGRVTVARSGHLYADIKDEKAVLNTVMWKGQVNRLTFRPEEGLEVVATGRLSTYPGRSNYQLIAEEMRPAGAGALMALLEERRKKLAAEGLFDQRHKKPLPFLPSTVGVVTSPTGAVIRDILHRIQGRFPVQVILWPALVQGDAAAAQITAGIRGFNAMSSTDRPDVLIVGRGGGSIEDLWPFNEEDVVRAAFESKIPLISAVGHETDTTLIDHVADARAPTPTGAAEIAVPVLTDLALNIDELEQRLRRGLKRRVQRGHDRLIGARLPRPERLLEGKRQRHDTASERLPRAITVLLRRTRSRFEQFATQLVSPKQIIQDKTARLNEQSARLAAALQSTASKKRIRFTTSEARLRSEPILSNIQMANERLQSLSERAAANINRLLADKAHALSGETKLLETLSYQATLKRGYAIVRSESGEIVRTRAEIGGKTRVNVSFTDGDVAMVPTGAPPPKPLRKKKGTKSGSAASDDPDQGNLF